MRERLDYLSLRSEHARLVVVRFGKAGVDAKRVFEMRAGATQVLLLGEHVAEIVLGLRVNRPRLVGGWVVGCQSRNKTTAILPVL